jgi:multidrug efflux pump subunit AcrA (membrane-fusion protein)
MSLQFKGLRFNAWLVLVCLLLLTGCGEKKPVKNAGTEIAPVKVAQVELRDVYRTLEYVGNIKAQDEVMVYPKVSGKIIEKIKEEGKFVEKGEVIAYIDRDEVGLKFEKAPVESPLKGVIGRVYVDIGSSVAPQLPVALVVNMDSVKIDLNIPEKHIPLILLGQQADIYVDAYREERFVGKVIKISPVLDLETRSAPITITIENKDHRLKSGMFAKVFLVVEERKAAPLVLKEAIMGKEPNFYVYVVIDGKAFLKDVKLGLRQNEYFEIREGLREGELVVIMGQQRLRDGIEVRVEGDNR